MLSNSVFVFDISMETETRAQKRDKIEKNLPSN